MSNHVNGVNPKILVKCRVQAGLELSDVKKKVSRIEKFELGEISPTFKQIDTLAQLYSVPRWVFISKELPENFEFEKSVPAFRHLKNINPELIGDFKVRKVIAKVEQLRLLVLELQEDMNDVINNFTPPNFENLYNLEDVSNQIRSWLGTGNKSFTFLEWKKLLETKGVFIFSTSKYKGWSNIDKSFFRGLSIYYKKLPIIIINDSDSKKAQSFTLFHELGHLIRKESSVDSWSPIITNEEKWCDELAGSILMPEHIIKESYNPLLDMKSVKNISELFKVSPYACIVRLHQLNIINFDTYQHFENILSNEYLQLQQKLKNSKGGPPRNRPNEILNQYGNIYTRVLFQAYHNKEIGLHKLAKLFDLKKASSIRQVEALI